MFFSILNICMALAEDHWKIKETHTHTHKHTVSIISHRVLIEVFQENSGRQRRRAKGLFGPLNSANIRLGRLSEPQWGLGKADAAVEP